MTTLKHAIESLAQTFAKEVLTIIRSASLEDILGQSVSTTRAAAPKTARGPRASNARKASKPGKRGRLARRSVGQIDAQLASVVGLLKKNPGGMRSEAIRAELKLDRREIPRVLADGLKSKAVRKTGAKGATTYRVN